MKPVVEVTILLAQAGGRQELIDELMTSLIVGRIRFYPGEYRVTIERVKRNQFGIEDKSGSEGES